MRRITILGATGSIGRNTAALLRGRDDIAVTALTGGQDIAGLVELAQEFRPDLVVTAYPERLSDLRAALAGTNLTCAAGPEAVIEAAARPADWVMSAIVGAAGLPPGLEALKQGKTLALANKESLVTAGPLLMDTARRHGATLLPVDSEHSAIFQCLEAQGGERALKRILLTGSGGPFRGLSREETKNATPAMAVAHPKWNMGAKISVDSATMMNKGLEFIEAMHLFSVTPDEIKVIIHPESVIHSMVEYIDGCVMAQLGVPDMALPIQYALTYPDRKGGASDSLDFAQLSKLSFFEPELEKTPCLALAMDCARRGGTAAAVMSAANEEAVALFLTEKLSFGAIADIVAEAVEKVAIFGTPSLEVLQDADESARRFVKENFRNY